MGTCSAGRPASRFGPDQEYYLQQTGGDEEPYGIGGALIRHASDTLNDGGTLVVIGVDDLDAYVTEKVSAMPDAK